MFSVLNKHYIHEKHFEYNLNGWIINSSKETHSVYILGATKTKTIIKI